MSDPRLKPQPKSQGDKSIVSTHSSLVREWADDRDPMTVTSGSDYLAQWKCPEEHVYMTPVKKRTKREYGCPYCSGKKPIAGENDLGTTHPHLVEEWVDDRDPMTLKAGSDYKAQWECTSHHHRYEASVSKRAVRNHGCPYCSGKRVLAGFNDLATTHSHLVAEWDDERDITTVSKGTNYRAQWKCEHGHVWKTGVPNRTIGDNNCPYCLGRRRQVGFNDLSSTHPHLAEIWDDEKDFKQFGSGSPYKAQWKCLEYDNHRWERRISDITKAETVLCPICQHREHLVGFNDVATTHPRLAAEWDDEQDITQFLAGSKYRAHWKCVHGHTWEAMIAKRTREQQGCPYCSGHKVLKGFNDLATTHSHLVAEWDDERDITTVNAGSEYKTRWKCSQRGHVWRSTINSRAKRNSGCVLCHSGNKASKAEMELVEYVESIGFNVDKDREILQGRELDIYIPEKNFAIEYHGLYWHTEGRGKDKWYHYKKWSDCKDKGVQLLTIWEDDYARNPDLIKQMIAYKLELNLALYNHTRVPAKRTTFERLNKQDATVFLERHHLQGSHQSSRHYGLRSERDNDLVGVMSIRYSSVKKEMEISRFATNGIIQGGFTKLLRNILRQDEFLDIEKVVSYSHNDHSDGGVYSQNGFDRVHSGEPGYHYVVQGHREHRLNYSPKRFRERSDLLYEEGLSERELATLNGLERIWDCGSSLWVLNLR